MYAAEKNGIICERQRIAMEEKIYNAHAHIFPAKISDKAVDAIGAFYQIPMQEHGTAEDLIADGSQIGVSRYLVCSTATKANQVQSINHFIAEETRLHPEFDGFGSLHPEAENIAQETERIIALGLKGIKLHQDFQEFNIDDPAAYPIYEAAEGRLPILFHTGDDRYEFSRPHRLLRIVEKFPKLTVIAAHLGGYQCWDQVHIYIGHPRIYIDTSSALMFVPPEKASALIHAHGIERVLFGTDFPMWKHKEELQRFNRLELTAQERKQVLYDNARNLIK